MLNAYVGDDSVASIRVIAGTLVFIPPDERRQLGEYYTPDWLARAIVLAARPRII